MTKKISESLGIASERWLEIEIIAEGIIEDSEGLTIADAIKRLLSEAAIEGEKEMLAAGYIFGTFLEREK